MDRMQALGHRILEILRDNSKISFEDAARQALREEKKKYKKARAVAEMRAAGYGAMVDAFEKHWAVGPHNADPATDPRD